MNEQQIFCCIYWSRFSIRSSAGVSGLSSLKSPACKKSQRLSIFPLLSLLIVLYHCLFLSYFLNHVFTPFAKGRLKMAATIIAGFHPVHTSNSSSTIFSLLIFDWPPTAPTSCEKSDLWPCVHVGRVRAECLCSLAPPPDRPRFLPLYRSSLTHPWRTEIQTPYSRPHLPSTPSPCLAVFPSCSGGNGRANRHSRTRRSQGCNDQQTYE